MNWSVRKWFRFICISLSIPAVAIASYHDCGECQVADNSTAIAYGAAPCVPITTPPYVIPLVNCNRPYIYVSYNPSWGAGGYIYPNPPSQLPNTLFVTNRCHEGRMKFRIEGKFNWEFSMYVVNEFIMKSSMCFPGYGVGDAYPRDPDRIQETELHEKTHCETLTEVINNSNEKVVQSGWHLTRNQANGKRSQIIQEANQDWQIAVARAAADEDVAGQEKSVVEGDCLIETVIGVYP